MEPLRIEQTSQSQATIRRKPVGLNKSVPYVAISHHGLDSQQTLRSDVYDDTVSELTEAPTHRTKLPSPRERSPHRRGRSQVWLWLPELLWCIASLILFGAIIAVLAWRDNKPLPDWYAGLTVNTVIALLATICRAATVVPISEGISQLKWNWLAQGTRPLRDLAVFDEASRGPWGSLRMACKARGQLFSIVAALVLTTGLATSTFTQSAIGLVTRPVVSANGTAVASKLMSTPEDLRLMKGLNPISDFQNAVGRAAWQAMAGPLDKVSPSPNPPTCSTSQCRWQRFNSLGVCMSLHNATDEVNLRFAGDPDITWPMATASLFNDTAMSNKGVMDYDDWELGIELRFNVTAPSISSNESFRSTRPRTKKFKDEPDLLDAAVTWFTIIMYQTGQTPPKFHAFELLWHFCTISYNWTVVDGEPKLDTSTYTKIVDRDETRFYPNDTAYITLGSADKRDNFNIRRNTTDRFLDIFDLADNNTRSNNLELFLRARMEYNITGRDVPYHTEEKVHTIRQNLERMGHSVAAGMTNTFLDYGENVRGSAEAPVVFIQVKWAWLSFIAAQIVLTFLFLIAVVWQTAFLNIEVVKSSTMATLFARHHHSDDLQPFSDGPDALTSGLRRDVDKTLTGHLERNDDGWSMMVERTGLVSK